MAATIYIYEMTAAGAGVDKTSGTVRFKSANETSVDTNNRLQIPAGSTPNYSYTKQLQFNFGTAPSVDIQNLRAYSDHANSFGTGIGVQYDVQGSFITNINTNIGGTDLFTSYSGSPISLGSGPYTGTGFKGSLLRLQMSVASSASPGQLSPEVLTMAWTNCYVPLCGNA
jgi:hypothetical protein